MLPPTSSRSPLGTPAVRRLLGSLCLLIVALVVAGGALVTRPASSRETSGDASDPALERPREVSLSPVEATVPAAAAVAAAVPTAAPTVAATAAPAPAPTRPVPDLGAVPPAPDPSLPSWAVNPGEAGLWSGPADGTIFTTVPSGATFRVLERQGARFRVFYPGDGAKRTPGEAWVNASDLAAAAWPRWVRLRGPASVMTVPSANGAAVVSLQPGTFVEVVGDARGNWARVFLIGDGRSEPAEGWLEAGAAAPIPGPDRISTFALGRERALAGSLDIWLKVPYRSQLDGTRYASANCGPTTANMVLESFGVQVSQPDLRREVLAYQPNETCDDCGVYVQNMAATIAGYGLKVNKLRDDKPDEFHRWTLDDIRAEVRAGRPVIVQVFFRGLPGRSDSGYWGDHYILVQGLLGDRFVYNDSIDSDGPGYSRVITPQALDFAMSQSDFPYAGFSVSR